MYIASIGCSDYILKQVWWQLLHMLKPGKSARQEETSWQSPHCVWRQPWRNRHVPRLSCGLKTCKLPAKLYFPLSLLSKHWFGNSAMNFLVSFDRDWGNKMEWESQGTNHIGNLCLFVNYSFSLLSVLLKFCLGNSAVNVLVRFDRDWRNKIWEREWEKGHWSEVNCAFIHWSSTF